MFARGNGGTACGTQAAGRFTVRVPGEKVRIDFFSSASIRILLWSPRFIVLIWTVFKVHRPAPHQLGIFSAAQRGSEGEAFLLYTSCCILTGG